VLAGAIVVAAVLGLATLAGFALRRRDGRLAATPRSGARYRVLTGTELGQPLGSRATLLQFSSSFCAPCRATRQLLADVAARDAGVTHVEIDVADRQDLVRLLDVRRTPTVFVLGPQGEVTRRASGLPRREDVTAAVAMATGGPGAGIGK
jgi:thiol-disulfide isomerase/thioredoxin